LERKIFTPARSHIRGKAFLKHAEKDAAGQLGKPIVIAVNAIT
jgi:hypothetical protein